MARGLKQCTLCADVLPLSRFKSHYRDGVRARCAECESKTRSENKVQTLKGGAKRARGFGCEVELFTYPQLVEHWLRSGVPDDNCFYCHNLLISDDIHLEHKTPLAIGGGHTMQNLVPSCSWCNSQKRNMTAEVFLELGLKRPDKYLLRRLQRTRALLEELERASEEMGIGDNFGHVGTSQFESDLGIEFDTEP